jgi:hypothetical protein
MDTAQARYEEITFVNNASWAFGTANQNATPEKVSRSG